MLDVFEHLWYCVCCQKAEQQGSPLRKGERANENDNRNHTAKTNAATNTACVRPLLSVALFGCNFSIVRNLAIIAFTRFIFRNLAVPFFQD